MLTVIVGLSGALIFGAADFLGGLASRKISSIRVAAISAVVGLCVLLLALPLIGGEWSREALLFGGLSGITGAGAIVLLYACLAIGPMSILSPLTAVVSALVPMTVGLIRGERLEPLGYLALGLALIAVVLVGFVPEKDAVRPTGKALAMAVGSGALIGAFLILIDLTPDASGLVPLIANRAVSAAVLLALILILWWSSRRAKRIKQVELVKRVELVETSRTEHSAALRLTLLCGVLDATANALLLLGLRLGELTVMSVLTAMYSAGTIILAAIVLKERLTPTQIFGLVLALAAAAMLALV